MLSTLNKYFGYTSFLPLQEAIVKDILGGSDALVLMPTGGGKSLCYQLPGLLLEGLTVVVSPLIALMKDQVDGLIENGVPAACINSSLAPAAMTRVRAALERGEVKLLYVAPERLMMPQFLDLLKRLSVSLFAVDEAHCISEWGHDFRPEYRRLASLKTNFPATPIIALTATATHQVRDDIAEQL
ncbi:MAG: DNA helicase RecQ, partial [Candidatus Aquicultor secundus]